MYISICIRKINGFIVDISTLHGGEKPTFNWGTVDSSEHDIQMVAFPHRSQFTEE